MNSKNIISQGKELLFLLVFILLQFGLKAQTLLDEPMPLLDGPTFNCAEGTVVSNPDFTYEGGVWKNSRGAETNPAPTSFPDNANIVIADKFSGNIKTTSGNPFSGIIKIAENTEFDGEFPDKFQGGKIYINNDAKATIENEITSNEKLIVRVCERGTLILNRKLELNPTDAFHNKGNVTLENGLLINNRSSFFNFKGGSLIVNGNDLITIVGRLSNYGQIDIVGADVEIGPSSDVCQNFCSFKIGGNFLIKRNISNEGVFEVDKQVTIFSNTFFNRGTLEARDILVDAADKTTGGLAKYQASGQNGYLIVGNKAKLINEGVAQNGKMALISNLGTGFDICGTCKENNIEKLTSFTIPNFSGRCKAIYNPYGIVKVVAFLDKDGNNIQDSSEIGVEGVAFTAQDSSTIGVRDGSTDANGAWTFVPKEGKVQFNIDASSIKGGLFYPATSLNKGSFEVDVEADTSTQVVYIPLIDVPTVSGYIFEDSDGDGGKVPGATEKIFPDVRVTLKDSANLEQTVTTDANGFWVVNNVANGEVTISIDASVAKLSGYNVIGDNPLIRNLTTTNINDANFIVKKITSNTIGGIIFEDRDGDLLRGGTEPGIANVKITVKDSSGKEAREVLTDTNGLWQMIGVQTGDIEITVDVASSNLSGLKLVTDNPIKEELLESTVFNELNFGFKKDITTSTIGGIVFNDVNGNEQRENGEAGFAGIEVTVKHGTNKGLSSKTTTDSNGGWELKDISIGEIEVSVDTSDPILSGFNIVSDNPQKEDLGSSGISDINFGFRDESKYRQYQRHQQRKPPLY